MRETSMLGNIISAAAGRTLARSLGGAAAGPAGAAIGAVVPVLIPYAARALGPAGMAAAAVGGLLFSRHLAKKAKRREALAAVQADARTLRKDLRKIR